MHSNKQPAGGPSAFACVPNGCDERRCRGHTAVIGDMGLLSAARSAGGTPWFKIQEKRSGDVAPIVPLVEEHIPAFRALHISES